MAKLYNEDGDLVEGALTPEEVEELKKKEEDPEKDPDEAPKLEELQKSLEEKEAELAKLRTKDMNFTKFRQKTKEEKACHMLW